MDEDGKPLIVYHQTAKDFTVFNTDNPKAGLNDSETPNGIFFKTNDHDIGLEGKKQVAFYLSIQKMLDFKDRAEANQWYRKNIDGYEDLDNEMKREVKRIEDNMDTIETNMFRDGVTDEEYDKLSKEWDGLLEEMRAIEDDYRGRLRSLLNDYFLNGNGDYDGIHLAYDGHRYVNGKRENVETYIAFKNTQVKSATDNIGTFDRSNPDIRYQSRDNSSLSAKEIREQEREKWEAREKELRAYFKEQRAKNVRQRNTTKLRNSVAKKFRSLDKKLNRSDKDKTVKVHHGTDAATVTTERD